MTEEDKINRLAEEVGAILAKRFKEQPKRKVYKYKDRLNFACPYCGDSASDKYKKRGNVYFDGMSFHCFNCGHHTDYITFMKDWGHRLSLERIDEIGDVMAKSKRNSTEEITKPEQIVKFSAQAVPRPLLKEKLSLIEPDEDLWCSRYLAARCMRRGDKRFLYAWRKHELCVLNVNETGDVLGMQVRSFRKGDVKYRTYVLSKIRELCGLPECDGDYDPMSTVYNIVNVNLLKPLFVFEGGIDSFILPNSIAVCGAKRNVPFVERLPSARYFFDNDKTGFKSAVKELERGNYVFMWSKYMREKNINAKIKDLNDLLIWARNNGRMAVFNGISGYFTNDMIDVVDV